MIRRLVFALLRALGRRRRPMARRLALRETPPNRVGRTQGDGCTCPKCRRTSYGLSRVCPFCGSFLASDPLPEGVVPARLAKLGLALPCTSSCAQARNLYADDRLAHVDLVLLLCTSHLRAHAATHDGVSPSVAFLERARAEDLEREAAMR